MNDNNDFYQGYNQSSSDVNHNENVNNNETNQTNHNMNYSRSNKSNNTRNKLLSIIPIFLVVAILIVGGFIVYNKFSRSNTPGEEKEKEVEVTPTPVPKSNIKVIDINSKTRPYGIMINCRNEALPQAGLQDAYIVYEIMVEFGITRMFAIFKDVDIAKVGSIRSVRNQYLGYAFENDAVIVHAGGSAEADGRIANEGIEHIDVDGKYGVRDRELAKKRAWEHTLFTNSTLLTKGMTDRNIRKTTEQKPLLTYSETELDLSKYQTTKANKVTIRYSSYRTSSYDYDANSKTFLRNIGSKKNTDLLTGKQYQVKNIIVYAVKHTTYTDHGYSGYQRLSNIGTGEGYYITDGVALPITWSKADEKSQTVYKIKETGENLVVNDGNTYIQIYPSNGGKLTIS